jgi:hypothetical protein
MLKLGCGLSVKISLCVDSRSRREFDLVHMRGLEITLNTGGMVSASSRNYPAQHTQLAVNASQSVEVHTSPDAVDAIGRIFLSIEEDIACTFNHAADEALCDHAEGKGLHELDDDNDKLGALLACKFITDVAVVPDKSCAPPGYTILEHDINRGINYAINRVFICYKRGDINAIHSGTEAGLIKRPIADMMIVRHAPTSPHVDGTHLRKHVDRAYGMCLRSANTAQFLGIDAMGQFRCLNKLPGTLNYFAIKTNGDGSIALNGPNDRFVTANADGTADCQARHAREVSSFHPIRRL